MTLLSTMSALYSGTQRGAIPLSLSSRAIRAAFYNPQTGDLSVTFNNGRTYTHGGVPPSEVARLEAAPSAGAHYDAAIRGNY